MQLGTAGGGVTVRAQDSGSNGRNITLSGILSDNAEMSGSLTKTGSGTLTLTGANTFTGGVTIKNGTVEAKTYNTALGAGTITMGGTGSTGATLITGRTLSNPITINAPDSGTMVIGANGPSSGYGLSGGIALNGNLTIQTFNNAVDPVIKSTGGISGGITGTGQVLLNNNGLSANVLNITAAAINHTGSLTLQGTATGNTNIAAAIGSNVTGITQNSATSTMVLSGTNTYACNLTVNAGTVRITKNTNTANDPSTVTIASTGATLDLTYSGTDRVLKLVIGSIQQANGVYGKLGSAPPIIGIPQITGEGTLTVAPVNTFASWISNPSFGLAAADQDLTDDPDGDGIDNGVENFFGTHPATFSQGLMVGTKNGNSFTFTHPQNATPAYDLTASYRWSADLTTFHLGGASSSGTTVTFTTEPNTPTPGFTRVTATATGTIPTRLFVDVRVTGP
jgi:autotransporter-associated beta strand protein